MCTVIRLKQAKILLHSSAHHQMPYDVPHLSIYRLFKIRCHMGSGSDPIRTIFESDHFWAKTCLTTNISQESPRIGWTHETKRNEGTDGRQAQINSKNDSDSKDEEKWVFQKPNKPLYYKWCKWKWNLLHVTSFLRRKLLRYFYIKINE